MSKKTLSLIAILILASVIIGGFWIWKNDQKVKMVMEEEQSQNKNQDKIKNENEDVSKIEFKNCNISLEKESNSTVKDFDPFKEEFNTSVCGYKIIKNESAHAVIGGYQKNIYFRVTEFADEKFKESLLKHIDNVSVKKDGDYVDIGIGCLVDNRIKGILQNSKEEGFYLEKSVENKIINSSENNQIALDLAFRDRAGSGCACCSLPYDIETQEINTGNWGIYRSEEYGFKIKLPGDINKWSVKKEVISEENSIYGSNIVTLYLDYDLDRSIPRDENDLSLGKISNMILWYINIIPVSSWKQDICNSTKVAGPCRQGEVLGKNDLYVFESGYPNVEGAGYLCQKAADEQKEFCNVDKEFDNNVVKKLDFKLIK